MNDAFSPEDGTPRNRYRTYAGVIAVEAVVVAALWWFSRYFSA